MKKRINMVIEIDIDMIDELFQKQKAFFQNGATLQVSERIGALQSLRSVIIAHEQAIYSALKADLGKPQTEAFLSEFVGMVHELDTAIAKVKRWSTKKRKAAPFITFPSKAFVVPEPLGQVLIISPWNYPFDLAISPLVGAITAGNTVVLKPSELTPNCSALLQKMLQEALPEELAVCVTGEADMAQRLLDQPFDHIFFTGSERVGKIVMSKAAQHLTPVTLELGGKCPVVIDKNYPVEKAAKSIAWGKWFNAGQTCVAPDYVFVHSSQKKAFVQAFNEFVKQFGQNAAEDLTHIINQANFNRLKSYVEDGNILSPITINEDNRTIEPLLLQPDNMDVGVMQEEIFGPILPLLVYDDKEEITLFIQKKSKPLVFYLFSSSSKEQKYWLSNSSSGNVCFNDTLLSYVNKNLPFGGVGASGMGAYHGKASFDVFSHYKSVHHKLNPDLPLRYPPYKWQYKLLRKWQWLLNKGF
ncbi:aldehyde dehydrogenase family protein [Prolixibacteraceae bacterium JC049]|nr:aldehyde dehydrogenase family protein [Prolixibacteraceae bacterium JC049]